MTAHSYIRTPGHLFFAYRESYSEELASLFKDDDLVTSLEAPVYETTAKRMRERMDVSGLTLADARRRLDAEYRVALNYDEDAESMNSWLDRNRWQITGADAPEYAKSVEDSEVPLWTADNPRLPFRLLLEELQDDDTIALDLEDVVASGHVPADPRLCRNAYEKYATIIEGPMIVLTEGTSDGVAIGGALDVLAPHLSGLIRFLDWDLKPEGGASAVVRGVRALAAAGVRNPVLALLDNDTAGAEAVAQLEATPLPTNFRVRRLPRLASATDYPTIGPTGHASLDINGSAVSVELFFGLDVLGENDGRPAIQWTGYSQKAKQYQGEILDKADLQQRFAAKVATARAAGGPHSGQDWADMQTLVDAIRTAFVGSRQEFGLT
ncbi:hypothetical protein [Ornithinimicrobium murale]|uniref:hypothetical protein n=1 Tax=Ornithinimicrobium murale TaxID=1050153 RepID=UPI000E0D1B9F|nr:hypothetical protein [Ornithinimicrobium murale]